MTYMQPGNCAYGSQEIFTAVTESPYHKEGVLRKIVKRNILLLSMMSILPNLTICLDRTHGAF